MRVSKTVREYIEKKVVERVAPKYEAEAQEAKRQRDIVESIREMARVAANEAYKKVIMEEGAKHDFIAINEDAFKYLSVSTHYNLLDIPGSGELSSVHRWQTRKSNEIDEVISNIIVELELGGTRADLERMLAEIGEG